MGDSSSPIARSPGFSQLLAAAVKEANCTKGGATSAPAAPVIPAIKTRLVIMLCLYCDGVYYKGVTAVPQAQLVEEHIQYWIIDTY